MKRRKFLSEASLKSLVAISARTVFAKGPLLKTASGASSSWIDPHTAMEWHNRWEKFILDEARRHRYCDTEMGEELGWLVSPFLEGFYYGYLATRETKWVELLIDWMDSCVRRGVKEPDGCLGWPKVSDQSEGFNADNMLGEAMMLRPVVLMADAILNTNSLYARWGAKARGYLELAEQIFYKWDSRSSWHDSRVGGLWVVQYFGIDSSTGGWTEGYARRKTQGFSHPDNKENLIARWLIAMFDATKKLAYRDRAEKWWQLMQFRMKTREDGKYFVWNYWEPAGPWDYKPDGSTKHWVGVHPNGGYYGIDVEGIVAAFEHRLVFTSEVIGRLIATNRDFMWNGKVGGAKFRRIDGGPPDPRWKNTPGVLWTALVPHDETLRKIFLANHKPGSWGGLGTTPWFLALNTKRNSR
jgi:hypothetical protein